jgi:hypothetical protein
MNVTNLKVLLELLLDWNIRVGHLNKEIYPNNAFLIHL